MRTTQEATTPHPEQSLPPTTRGRSARAKRRPPAGRSDKQAWLFLAPVALVFAVFTFYPLVRTVVLSFQGTDILGRPSGFVGAKHYLKLFEDPSFYQVLGNTALFTLLTVAPTILISLVLALLLEQRIAFPRVFRTALVLPFAYSVATGSVVFAALFNPTTGLLNNLLGLFGQDPVGWVTDPKIALISVSLATVWMQLGYNILVLIAGLGTVPPEVVEAARIDGADGWRLTKQIHIPLLMPQIFFLLVIGTINALQSFGQIHILTGGGPAGSTNTLVYSIYDTAFANNNSNYGYASAQAIVLLLVVTVITAIQFGVIEKRVHYA